jgi:hypothetical protein
MLSISDLLISTVLSLLHEACSSSIKEHQWVVPSVIVHCSHGRQQWCTMSEFEGMKVHIVSSTNAGTTVSDNIEQGK